MQYICITNTSIPFPRIFNSMSLLKYIDRVKRIDNLIRLKATGSPKELAFKLGTSEWVIYQHLKEMKELGAPIAYCFQDNSYIYLEKGKFDFSFQKYIKT